MNFSDRTQNNTNIHGRPRIKTARAGNKQWTLQHSRLAAACAIVLSIIMCSPVWALDTTALPTGGSISAGSGSISSSCNAMTINQSSSNLAINWQSYNIGSAASVTYVQPSSSSVALNRVIGTGGSEIYGTLNANGQVFVLNSNGILFGANAQVNVGGLVATTLNLSDEDFMAGNYNFGGTAGRIINNGSINGQYVALLGGQVSNQGTITAKLGKVILAAGEAMTLDFAGDGLTRITVDQGTINALVENKQLIKADGGTVIMTAMAADSLIQAVVNNEGVIEANTVEDQSGTIVLLSDMDSGVTMVSGTLDASAPNGGAGGFIETSGASVEIQEGAVVTAGEGGSWLIDPTDITIDSAAASTIVTALDAGTNVTETTSSSGTDEGDITVASAISWTGTGTLTLTADDDININAAITGTNGGLTLSAGDTISTTAAVNVGTFTLQSGTWSQIASVLPTFSATDFRLEGGTFLRALGGDGTTQSTAYQLTDIYGVQGIAGSGMLDKYYVLANDIDASGTSGWNSNAGFDPIGYYNDASDYEAFTGRFDGQGYVISGLTISRSSESYVGLFSNVEKATIANVGLVGGSIQGRSYVGGLAGYDYKSTIKNSYVTGNVSGINEYVGGLLGYGGYSTISNSYVTGNVTGTGSSTEYVGGLLGYGYFGSIGNSYVTGSVSGYRYTGGLVGYADNTAASNSYVTGSVSGYKYIGGLEGYGYYVNISNSYATGSVSGNSDVGGLVGYAELGYIFYSFWDTGTTGQSAATGTEYLYFDSSTGLTTADMMSYSTYSSLWDISDTGGSSAVWRIYDGYTYPLLASFLTDVTVTANSGTRSYDGTTAGLGVTYSSTLDNSLIYGESETSSKDAGSRTTVSGLYSSQQGYDIEYVSGTVTILPATLTVTGTAVDLTRVYDGSTDATISTAGTLSGLVSGETLTLWQSGSYNDKDVADANTITVTNTVTAESGDTALLSNYTLATTGETFTGAGITPAELIVGGSSVASSKVYDGTATAKVFGGTISGLISGDDVTLSQSGRFSDMNVGTNKTVTYTNGLSGTDAGNYVLETASTTGTSSADITAATLRVTANSASKWYDGQSYSGGNGVSYSGFVAGEDASVISGTLTYGGTGQGATNIGSYSIAVNGLSASNYTINYVDGALTIRPNTGYNAAVMQADSLGFFQKQKSLTQNLVNPGKLSLPASGNGAPGAEIAFTTIIDGGVR